MARSGRPHARAGIPGGRSRPTSGNGHRLGAGGAGDRPAIHPCAEPVGRGRRCLACARPRRPRQGRSVAGAAAVPCLHLRRHRTGRRALGSMSQGLAAKCAGRPRTGVRAAAHGRLRAGVLPGGGAGAARTQLQHHRARAGARLRRRADGGAAGGEPGARDLRAGRRTGPVRGELPPGTGSCRCRPGAAGARARARRRNARGVSCDLHADDRGAGFRQRRSRALQPARPRRCATLTRSGAAGGSRSAGRQLRCGDHASPAGAHRAYGARAGSPTCGSRRVTGRGAPRPSAPTTARRRSVSAPAATDPAGSTQASTISSFAPPMRPPRPT